MMSNDSQNKAEPTPVPIGTWALLCAVAFAMTAAWLFLYFGVFLPRGTVH